MREYLMGHGGLGRDNLKVEKDFMSNSKTLGRVLVITRMFTGFIESVNNQNWRPTGMPAIYKFIEGLNQSQFQYDLVFLGKRKRETTEIHSKKVVNFSNFKGLCYVFPYKENRIFKSSRIDEFITLIYHLWTCFNMVRKHNYDLIYIDRPNIILAAFFTLFMRKKVVVRFLGIKPGQKSFTELIGKLKAPLTYLCHKARFAYVICSQDGSGGEYYLKKILNRSTSYEVLLNGIDSIEDRNIEAKKFKNRIGINNNFPVILFVGKMETQKGCREFIEALIALNKINSKFKAIMVGDGPLQYELKERVKKSGLSKKIVLTGAVEHKDIYGYYSAANIYVSLNKLGNLSNTVLEAFYYGQCLVILNKELESHTDEETEVIIPEHCAVRIDRKDIIGSLTGTLNQLLDNPARVSELSQNARTEAKRVLRCWNDRIAYEMQLLKNIVKG
ncbi:glycosyltransferase family 4 protein [Candidatus Omnitrophota bacterium]